MSPDLTPVEAPELIAWRTNLGLTQAEAAELLPVSIRTYQGWEAGRPAPAHLRGAMRDAARRHAESVRL